MLFQTVGYWSGGHQSSGSGRHGTRECSAAPSRENNCSHARHRRNGGYAMNTFPSLSFTWTPDCPLWRTPPPQRDSSGTGTSQRRPWNSCSLCASSTRRCGARETCHHLCPHAVAFAISGMVFSCAHILATLAWGNGRLVARLRIARRALFFGFVDALDNDPPRGFESWDY
jgi:hypothetical protein